MVSQSRRIHYTYRRESRSCVMIQGNTCVSISIRTQDDNDLNYTVVNAWQEILFTILRPSLEWDKQSVDMSGLNTIFIEDITDITKKNNMLWRRDSLKQQPVHAVSLERSYQNWRKPVILTRESVLMNNSQELERRCGFKHDRRRRRTSSAKLFNRER